MADTKVSDKEKEQIERLRELAERIRRINSRFKEGFILWLKMDKIKKHIPRWLAIILLVILSFFIFLWFANLLINFLLNPISYGNTLRDEPGIALGSLLGVVLVGFVFYKGIKYLWHQSKKQSIKISKEEKKAKYCKWSTAALIFAMLGGWLGIVFGIIALFRIKKNPNLRGKTEAIVAIIIAFPMMFIWIYLSVLDPAAFLPTTYLEEVPQHIEDSCSTYCIAFDDATHYSLEYDYIEEMFSCYCLNNDRNQIASNSYLYSIE